VDQVAKLLNPLMRFYYHDGVRTASVNAMPALITSAALYFKAGGPPPNGDAQYLSNLATYILDTLLEAIVEEISLEVQITMIESLFECIDAAGPNCLSQELIKKIVEILTHLFTDVDERRQEREESKQSPDFDEEEQEKKCEGR